MVLVAISLVEYRRSPMLIAVDDRAVPTTSPADDDCGELELRWLVTAGGALAAHHTLHITSGGLARAHFLRGPLPRWSATTAAWAPALRWDLRVRPRVLRATDAVARPLGVTGSAAALVLLERGRGPADLGVEHELVVLAGHAAEALPYGWQQRAARLTDGRTPSWSGEPAAA